MAGQSVEQRFDRKAKEENILEAYRQMSPDRQKEFFHLCELTAQYPFDEILENHLDGFSPEFRKNILLSDAMAKQEESEALKSVEPRSDKALAVVKGS